MSAGESRIPPAEIEALLAATPLVPLIAGRVKLARSGRNFTARCPFHNERTPSFYIYPDGHYHCFGCGAHGNAITFTMQIQGVSFPDAVRLLKSGAGISERTPPAVADSTPAKVLEHRDERQRAYKIWKESLPIGGTIVEKYLWFRGATVPRRSCLRFHPTCPRGKNEKLPAMVAAMTTPDNEFCGVHRTFLRADGMGKIEHGKAKMMLGRAGVIRLAPNDEITTGLGICEGIETGLALIQRAGWVAIWAAGSRDGIAKFPVLNGIDCLTIFPDRDDSGDGAKAAEACAQRWSAAGRETQIIWPPSGTDWNDVLAKVAA